LTFEKEIIMQDMRALGFSPVLSASGTLGYFGEGWKFHRLTRHIGSSFDGMGLVAKTMTLHQREGNMPTNTVTLEPQDLFPDCIRVKFGKKAVINSVGLTNTGCEDLISRGIWQDMKKEVILSFMTVAASPSERINEILALVDILKREVPYMGEKPFAAQLNLSCPNTDENPNELIKEASYLIDIAGEIGIPIIAKFNALAPAQAIAKLQNNSNCAGIATSNTLPWGSGPVNWSDIWGSDKSPIPQYGGGGYSGPALVPLVEKQIRELRALGFTKYINAGGGITTYGDITRYKQAGADSIFMGSVAITRPWMVDRLIKYGLRAFS